MKRSDKNSACTDHSTAWVEECFNFRENRQIELRTPYKTDVLEHWVQTYPIYRDGLIHNWLAPVYRTTDGRAFFVSKIFYQKIGMTNVDEKKRRKWHTHFQKQVLNSSSFLAAPPLSLDVCAKVHSRTTRCKWAMVRFKQNWKPVFGSRSKISSENFNTVRPVQNIYRIG